jgi:hypothetical protein
MQVSNKIYKGAYFFARTEDFFHFCNPSVQKTISSPHVVCLIEHIF